MTDTLTIRIEGQHGSLCGLKWPNVPPLAVVTGVNGAGKSQLLEILASSYNALLRSRDGYRMVPSIDARATLWSGDMLADIRTHEVLHAYAEWAPQGAGAVTEDHVRQLIRRLHQEALDDLSGNPYPTANQFLRRLDRSGVSWGNERPSLDEVYKALTPRMLWEYASASGPPALALLFLSYRLFEREALGSGESEQEIRQRFGRPPWEFLNEILYTSGLPFRVIYPEPAKPAGLFHKEGTSLRLYDIERRVEVPFEGLSSGEKVIMSTVIWNYTAQQGARHPKLLLLDEPDAHLHPSLVRRFLKVIQEVFVRQRGMRIILTTHSPSTVALTPEGSLFEMGRISEPRIRPAPSKERAIAVLTEGFVAVQEATRTVLLEGHSDPRFYTVVWDLLTECNAALEPGPLEPYPSLAFLHGGGKETVRSLVEQMQRAGLHNFFGIIDRDRTNKAKEGVYVLGRNAMENYLYDPLNVWALLNRQGKAPDDAAVSLIPGRESQIRTLPDADLQRLIDAVLARVRTKLEEPVSEYEEHAEEVSFVGGARLRYPRWFLQRDDKKIKKACCDTFGAHLLRPKWPDDLLSSYATLNMVPSELLTILQSIQASGNP